MEGEGKGEVVGGGEEGRGERDDSQGTVGHTRPAKDYLQLVVELVRRIFCVRHS